MSREIKKGRVGAQAISGVDARQGYYLLKFTSRRCTDQTTGKLMCDGEYMNDVKFTSDPWFTPNIHKCSVEVSKIVSANVEMESMSPTNLPHSSVIDECAKLGAMKVSDSSHGFILEQMRNRDAVEFDPNRIYVNGDESDADEDEEESVGDSNDEEEEEEE